MNDTTPTPASAPAQATPITDDVISQLLYLLGEFSRGNIYVEDLSTGMKLALAPVRRLERENADLVAALEDLAGDLQTRIDDGAKFNPGTLFALGIAQALIAAHKKGTL